MHFHFFEHYWDGIEKQIGINKTDDLKESLTVLLNLEFKDLWFKFDQGYPNHQELRKFISDNVNAVTKEVDNRMSLVFADQNQKTITSLDDLYSFSL